MSDKHPKYKWIFDAPDDCIDCMPYTEFYRKLKQQRTRPKTIMGQAIYNYVRNYFADHVRRITTS